MVELSKSVKYILLPGLPGSLAFAVVTAICNSNIAAGKIVKWDCSAGATANIAPMQLCTFKKRLGGRNADVSNVQDFGCHDLHNRT